MPLIKGGIHFGHGRWIMQSKGSLCVWPPQAGSLHELINRCMWQTNALRGALTCTSRLLALFYTAVSVMAEAAHDVVISVVHLVFWHVL